MLFNLLINYIFGYVHIVVEGYFIERFINICVSKRINLWNMKREKSTILYTNVSIKEFKKIKPILKNTKCKEKIISKKGIPFILNKYKKRKVFFSFLLILLLGIYISSLFVWNIEIMGNTNVRRSRINRKFRKKRIRFTENLKEI